MDVMKRQEAIIHILKRRVVLFAAVLCLIPFVSSTGGAQTGNQEFVKGEIIVELKPGASIDGLNARFGTRTLQRMYGTNFYRLGTPKSKKESKWRKKVAKDADVLSASLNPVVVNPINVFARATQNFPDGFATPGRSQAEYKEQHFELSLSDVHRRSSGAGVVVAVIDTGVDLSHGDLASRLWTDSDDPENGVDDDSDGLTDDFRGWDFIADDNNPTDEPGSPQTTIAGHGTFIAGIIALLALDLGVFNRKAHVISVKEALGWSAFWIALGLLFGIFIYFGYERHWLGLGGRVDTVRQSQRQIRGLPRSWRQSRVRPCASVIGSDSW